MSETEAKGEWTYEARTKRIEAVNAVLREAAPDFYAAASGLLLPDGSLKDGENSPRQTLTSAYSIGCPPERGYIKLLDPSGRQHPHLLWEDVSFLAERDGVHAELVSALLMSERHAPCAQDFSVQEQLGYIRRAIQRELGVTRGFLGRRDRPGMMPLLRQTALQLREYRVPERRYDVPDAHHNHH